MNVARKAKAPVREFDIETILDAYEECAIWSSTDDEGRSLDDVEAWLTEEASASMREDIENFVELAGADLTESGLDDGQIGHDFWLTRNGHGAGFWDRGLGALGDRLTKHAKSFGSSNLFVDGDEIHVD